MPFFPAVNADTTWRAAVVAARARATLPAADTNCVVGHGTAWPVAVTMKQLGHRATVLCCQQGRFGYLVMALSKEGADAGLCATAAPTGTRRDEPWKFCTSHHTKISLLGEASSWLTKCYMLGVSMNDLAGSGAAPDAAWRERGAYATGQKGDGYSGCLATRPQPSADDRHGSSWVTVTCGCTERDIAISRRDAR